MKYAFWPDFLCGSVHPTCNIYWSTRLLFSKHALLYILLSCIIIIIVRIFFGGLLLQDQRIFENNLKEMVALLNFVLYIVLV